MTETPPRPGCTCPPRAGFGQERVHDTSNASCALNHLRIRDVPGYSIDELAQVRLLLQAAGVQGTPAQGVRALVAERDDLREQLAVWVRMYARVRRGHQQAIRAENEAVFRAHSGYLPRAFVLVRDVDETGVSGTGVVAQGVEFTDGTVALRWTSAWPTSVVFHDRGVESVEAVHGHGGKTRVVWT